MRETPTPGQERLAKEVYEFMLSQPIGVIVPAEQVMVDLSMSRNEVAVGYHWAIRTICVKSGVLFASKRGPYGGYYITDEKSVAQEDEVRWLSEDWTSEQRSMAKVESRIRSRLGNRTLLREQRDSHRARIDSIENGLARLGVTIGHVAAELEHAE